MANVVVETRMSVNTAVQPIAMGSGQPLFGQLPAAQHLNLVDAKSFPCGVVVQVYTPRQGSANEIPNASAVAEGS